MANRNFPQSRQWSFNLMPVRVDCKITIGSSGAVSAFAGQGIKGVSHVAAGVYQVQFMDNYAAFLSLESSAYGTVTGSALDPNTATPGSLYQITTVGTTNWVTAGIPAGITPAVGMTFALLAAPTAATGRVKVYVPSAISNIQPLGDPNAGVSTSGQSKTGGFFSNQPLNSTQGGYIAIVCEAATSSSVTTLIPTNPASGEVLKLSILLNNSSVQ